MGRKIDLRQKVAAFALAEAMVAAGILAAVFAGLFGVANRSKALVSAGEIGSTLQRNCLARVDQLRSIGWAKVTKPDTVAALLAQPSSNTVFTKEVISVYDFTVPDTLPLPPGGSTTTTASTTPVFTVTKTGTAAPVISPSTFDAATTLSKRQLNYRVLTSWTIGGRANERELSTIISKSGSR